MYVLKLVYFRHILAVLYLQGTLAWLTPVSEEISKSGARRETFLTEDTIYYNNTPPPRCRCL